MFRRRLPISLTILFLVAITTTASAEPVVPAVIDSPYELPITNFIDEVDIVDSPLDLTFDENTPEGDSVGSDVPLMSTLGVDVPFNTSFEVTLDFESSTYVWAEGAELTIVGNLPEGINVVNLSEKIPDIHIQGYVTPEMLGEYPLEVWLKDIATGLNYDTGKLIFSVYEPIDTP